MRRPSATGVLLASAAWVVGWMPSLLPTGSMFQGITLGILASTGYAIGAALSALARLGTLRPAPPRWYAVLATAAAVLALLSGLRFSRWESAQAASIGAPAFTAGWFLSTLIGLAVTATLVFLARSVRSLTRALSRRIARRRNRTNPEARATPATNLLAAGLVVVAAVGLGAAGMLATSAAFDSIDASEAGQTQPNSSTRSGSPASAIEWSTLGRQGREFVAGGDDHDTIRTFAGLNSADSPNARADLAVQDMLRAGGAASKAWIGITTTGNGFVDPVAAAMAEKVADGDTALVAIQYSTLPSWLAFLVDQPAAKDAGVALYESLVAAREALPAEQRPRLVLYGESLGAYGSPAPFAGLEPSEVAENIDGALWVGPPAATDPITNWTYQGEPPVWQPIVAGGLIARYAATEGSTQDPPPEASPWREPRILVLQNPTDPVVWFSPRLIWSDPPWLSDPRGPGVADATRWTPLLFFLQVAMDLPQAVSYPSGVGHNYSAALQQAWEQILAP